MGRAGLAQIHADISAYVGAAQMGRFPGAFNIIGGIRVYAAIAPTQRTIGWRVARNADEIWLWFWKENGIYIYLFYEVLYYVFEFL